MKVIRDFLGLLFWFVFGMASLGLWFGSMMLYFVVKDIDFAYVGALSAVSVLGTMVKMFWWSHQIQKEYEYDDETEYDE